ncbi:MAG: FAD-binding oxidoreductase [Pseudomonadota bacterium]
MKDTRETHPQAGTGLFAEDFQANPCWLDDLPELPDLPTAPPASADAVVIGSGYTGLNAALQLARGGRQVVVLEAGEPGAGCSTRNGGQIHEGIHPSSDAPLRAIGPERAKAALQEGPNSVDWLEQLITEEQIDCNFGRFGSYHAAHTPQQYERMARRAEADGEIVVSRAEQHRELGSDHYFGGVVNPSDGSLQPAKYHRGLMERCLAAGVTLVPHCPATGIEAEGDGFEVATPTARIKARNVAVATNGYTGTATPWMRRRVVPIGSYMIATEKLAPEVIDKLIPTLRAITDTRKVIYYYRVSPDRQRIVFGGRVSAAETDPLISGPKLHRQMVEIFPVLAQTKISHSWFGTVAFSFDELPHTGVHDGIHYAMTYCGSGVAMASYLGAKMGQKILGLAEGQTALDNLHFPTRPLYTGNPWFLPAVVGWYRWRDDQECKRAHRRT